MTRTHFVRIHNHMKSKKNVKEDFYTKYKILKYRKHNTFKKKEENSLTLWQYVFGSQHYFN